MALFNGGFPATYQPVQYQPVQYQPMQYQQQPQQQQQQAQPMSSNMIWVSGEAGAKAYLVAPNTTVQLWDSESQTIYLKSADESGMPTMKILDYTIREAQAVQNMPTLMNEPLPEYVTKAELDDFEDRKTIIVCHCYASSYHIYTGVSFKLFQLS